jgi:hypothetical protein
MMSRTAPSNPSLLPSAFSSVSGLGAPVAFFEPDQRARVVPLACAAVCAVGALVTLAYGLAASATAYNQYGWAVVQALGGTPALVFWLFVVGGLLFGAYALVTWARAVALYEGGIAFRTLSSIRAWPWSDLTALYVSVTREGGLFPRTRHRYVLEHVSGDKVAFDDRLEKVTELGALLGHQMVEQHYPLAAGHFNAGESANFGQVSVDQNGIQLKGRTVPWGGMDFVSVRRGYLQIHPRSGAAAGLPVAAIPNLDVLLLLLDHVTDVRLEE